MFSCNFDREVNYIATRLHMSCLLDRLSEPLRLFVVYRNTYLRWTSACFNFLNSESVLNHLVKNCCHLVPNSSSTFRNYVFRSVIGKQDYGSEGRPFLLSNVVEPDIPIIRFLGIVAAPFSMWLTYVCSFFLEIRNLGYFSVSMTFNK